MNTKMSQQGWGCSVSIAT